MNYCFQCGKEIPEGSGFCPYCGAALQQAQPVYVAEPEKPKLDGGVKGKSIASVILGGEGIGVGIVSFIYVMLEGLFFLIMNLSGEAAELAPLSIMFYVYVFIFAIIAMGSCIAARILSVNALSKNPEFKLAKAGKILGLAGIIVSACSLIFGLFPLLGLLF